MLDVLQDALGTLPQESGASPHSGNGALARKLLERETFALTHAPHRLQVAEAVARRLEELLPTDPAACLEALRQLPQWTAFLQAGPLPAGDASQSHLAARRLRALATHLDSRLRRHVGEESVGATHALLELCDWLEALPMQEHVPDEAAWRELRHGGWDMAPLLARLDEELLRLRREVDKRAEQLRQRFLGSRGEDGQALPWVLEQLALDPAPPEQWLWLHHSLQRQARRPGEQRVCRVHGEGGRRRRGLRRVPRRRVQPEPRARGREHLQVDAARRVRELAPAEARRRVH